MKFFLCILNRYDGAFQACLDYRMYFLGWNKKHEYEKLSEGDVVILCRDKGLYAYGQIKRKIYLPECNEPEFQHIKKNESLFGPNNEPNWPFAVQVEWYGRNAFAPIGRGKVSDWVEVASTYALVKSVDLSDKLVSLLGELNPHTALYDTIKSML